MDLTTWIYPAYPIPADEQDRLDTLAKLAVLDAPRDPRFDRLTRLAAQLLEMPMCAISLMDCDRQFFLSEYHVGVRETARELAFCNHVVASGIPQIVPDATQDPRFSDNPLVTGEFQLRFYAGVPITDAEGTTLGSLCVLDRETHAEGLSPEKLSILQDLAAVVVNEMTSRMIAERAVLESDLRRQLAVELEDQRQEALATARFKSEFLANMSHEIRTPLNGVIGMAELLQDTVLSDEQREYLETLLHSAESLLSIINDVLDISKIEAQQMHYEEVSFCLRHEIEHIAQVLAQKAAHKPVDVMVEIQPDFPTAVVGDPTRIAQIIFNLAGNAVKFTEQGFVCLRLESVDRDHVRITVQDSGIGMDAEQLARLFEKFTQADSSITRRYGGTGLGMAIVKQLVAAFNGEIAVDSVPGEGTTVTLSLRLPHAPDAICDMRVIPNGLAGARVVVIDDLPLNRQILAAMLESHGAVVACAEDGFSGLAAVERAQVSGEPFDAVLCDHHMPGLSGASVVTRLATLVPELPVIVLTSGGHSEALKAANPLRVLHKPARAGQLIPALTDALMRRSATVQGARIAPERNELSGEEAGPLAGLHVLVAEDNATNQLVISKLLAKLGCTRVDLAENGRIAVEKIEQLPDLDLVLMDIQMPEMSGLDACALVRAKPDVGHQNLPIIALTANALEGDRERFLASGFSGYCAKPVRKPDLLAAIHAVRS